MPICENCHNEWTWKETFKRSFTLYSKMTCPYCGQDQFITQKSKLKSFFFNMIVLLPLVLNLFFNIHGVIILSLFPVLFTIVILIHPFYIDISSTDPFGYKP